MNSWKRISLAAFIAAVFSYAQQAGAYTHNFKVGGWNWPIIDGAQHACLATDGSGTLDFEAATDANTASALVLRDASGGFSAGTITGTSLVSSGGTVTATTLARGSGTMSLNSSGAITVPSATDTLVGKATTDTLTNKNMSGISNTFSFIPNSALSNSIITLGTTQVGLGGTITTINGLKLTNSTIADGTTNTKQLGFSLSGATASTQTTLTFAQTAARAITFPDATDTLLGRATTDTLTNKTLSTGGTNLIGSTAISGTTGTGSVVFSASPTLTGTLTGATGAFSNFGVRPSSGVTGMNVRTPGASTDATNGYSLSAIGNGDATTTLGTYNALLGFRDSLQSDLWAIGSNPTGANAKTDFGIIDHSQQIVPYFLISSGGSVQIGKTGSTAAHATNGSMTFTASTGQIMSLLPGQSSSGGVERFSMAPASGHYNWQIGSNFNANDQFEITPSTAADGSTFSHPALYVGQNGVVQAGNQSAASLALKAGSSSSAGVITFSHAAASGKYNWLTGADFNSTDTFEITPSTATDGATFGSPVFKVSQAGAVTTTLGLGINSANNQLGYSAKSVTSNGGTSATAVELLSDRSTDSQTIGAVSYGMTANTADKEVAYVKGLVSGATAGDQGGYLSFGTKADASGAAAVERLKIDRNGVATFKTTSAIISGAAATLQIGDSTAAQSSAITAGATSGQLYLTGGTGSGNSGQIGLFGSTHATKANYVEFRNAATVNGFIDGNGKWTIGVSGGAQTHIANGNLTLVGALATQNYDTASPLTGSTVTASSNKPGLLLTPAGTLAALTVKLPASPADGQLYWIASSQTVTGMTWQDSAGTAANVIGGPASLSTSGCEFVFNAGGSKWYGVGGGGGGGASTTVSGSRGSPNAITAAGGITPTAAVAFQTIFIQGSGGAVTVTANPRISAGTVVGQQLTLLGESDVNTVTLADGNGLSQNGSVTLGANGAITYQWDGTNWVETSRR